jgi:sulfur transfer complex TusBCD TusB component (DsrH family)
MSEHPHAHMLFIPTELYVGLFKKMASLEIGESAALLDALNEDLHNRGFIDEVTYQKFKERYTRKLVDVVREKTQESSFKVEVSSAKFEIQKSKVEAKRHTDYSKLTDDELLECYRKAMLSNDVVMPQLIQGEARRRGYRFKADASGNVQKISLKAGVSNE